MTRRRLPLLLAVVGAVIILAALVAASVVRSADTATLALPERPEVPVVITEPGVLDAVAPDVTVRATADDDEPVVLAIGRTAEVEAWLADADHARVTGLSSWEELTVDVVVAGPEDADDATPTGGATATAGATPAADATPSATPTDEATASPGAVPDPAGSDLWLAETVSTGSAELAWTDAPGQWSLVAATDGSGPAPLVELEWGRQASTPWLVPVVLLGVVVLLAGVVMIVLDVLAAREQRRRDEEVRRRSVWEPRGTGPVASAPVSVHDTDPGTGERFSRRQLREMERAMARAERGRSTGEVPPVPQAPGAASDDEPAPEPARDAAAHDDASGTTGSQATGAQSTDSQSTGAESTTEPGTTDPEPPAVAGTGEDAGPEDDDAAPPPSWRSVWGFGAPPARPDDDRPATTEGEER